MLKQFILLLTFFCSTGIAVAQDAANSKEYHYQLMEELDGVYQIQLVNSRAKPAITTEMLQFIKDNQQDSEQIVYQYTPIIRLIILSREEVNIGKKFSSQEQITYITE